MAPQSATSSATRKVWIVVHGFWSYNDEFDDGGETSIKAFRSRERAEEYIRAREQYHSSPEGQRELNMAQGSVRYQIVETEVEIPN